MAKAIIYKIFFLSWMVFVTFSSLFSFGDFQPSRFNIPHTDKIVHFTFYFGVVVLGFLALQKEGSARTFKQGLKLLSYVVAFAILYGISIEFIQHFFTIDRHGDLLDALANSTGAFVGMLLMKSIFLKKLSLK